MPADDYIWALLAGKTQQGNNMKVKLKEKRWLLGKPYLPVSIMTSVVTFMHISKHKDKL